MIPDEITLPGTDMYLMFGFKSKIMVEKDKFMRLPMYVSL